MKNIVFLFIILCVRPSFAQIFKPFENSTIGSDFISTPLKVNNSIYYLSASIEIDSNHTVLHTHNLSCHKLSLIDGSRNSNPLLIDSGRLIYPMLHIVYKGDSLYTIIAKHNNSAPNFFNQHNIFEMELIVLDTNLNLHRRLALPLMNNSYQTNIAFTFFNDSTIVISNYYDVSSLYGQYQHVNIYTGASQYFYTSISSDLISSFSLMNDSTLLTFNTQGYMKVFDSNLICVDTIPLYPLAGYNVARIGYGINKMNDDYIFNALLDSSLAPNKQNVIFKYNYANNSYHILHSAYTTSHFNNSYRSIDHLDSLYIFFINVTPSCNVSDFNNADPCHNMVEITKLDSVGNSLWKRYVGNDAAYFGFSVTATPDSGCLVLANRYDTTINHNEYDVYYIKFDKAGNQQNNFHVIPTKVYDVVDSKPLLYPNPCYDKLEFSFYRNGSFTFNVYTVDGKLVKSIASQFNSVINISDLASSTYYYLLKDEGKSFRGVFQKLK
jgi:hypothetical protein